MINWPYCRWKTDRLISANNEIVSTGFPRFTEFSNLLVPLYRNRAPGKTLADLYPQIVQWFEFQKRSHA